MATDLPLFPLGAVLLPGYDLPLHIFEPRYRTLVEDLLAKADEAPARFGVIAIRLGHEVGVEAARDLHAVGCVAEVNEVTSFEDGRYLVQSTGMIRFRVRSVRRDEAPYLMASVELLPEPAGPDAEELAAAVMTGFDGYADVLTELGVEVREPRSLPSDPVALSYAIAGAMVLDLNDRQRLLECDDASRRLSAERVLLRRETALIDALGSVPGDDLLRGSSMSVN
ncbi:LON peptidase substrate-binding domain-containing protein [Acidothermaceae bacterium B102]|nr:LON peptidase substrate-binding domain-containing protein [Acidothermaceae bacterium B102]